MDIDKANQIDELLNKAKKAHNLNKKNECMYLEQVLNLYSNLSSQAKELIDIPFYVIHRNLGYLYSNSKNIEKALYHLQEAKKLKEFNEEEFLTKYNLNIIIVDLNIQITLKTNTYQNFKDAKDLNTKLLNEIDKIELKDLKRQIKCNKILLDSIENDDIKTIIEFEIPSPIPIQENNPIKFKFNGIEHILNIEIVENQSSNIKGSGIPIPEDKYGIVKRSKVKLVISKYIDPEEHVKIKTFSYKDSLSKTSSDAIDALNYFIERYRIVTGKYWVETVFFSMIKNFECGIKFNNYRLGDQSSIYDQNFLISPNIPYLKDNEVSKLINCLKMKEIQLWEILLLDAKDFLLRRNYREAIYSINGAFENYLMIHAKERLSKVWGKENASEYLKGTPIYKHHKLKKYMDEKTFNQALKNNDINIYVPPIGQILKECRNARPLKISTTKLNNLVDKIRKERNNVMHGVEINDDLEIIAFEAIKSFEEFVKVFNIFKFK